MSESVGIAELRQTQACIYGA